MESAADVELLRQPSYTPPRRALDGLLARYLVAEDPAEQRLIATVLRRTAIDAFVTALARLPQTLRPARARLVALAGRLLSTIVEQKGLEAPIATFVPFIFDDDVTAARQAISALGRLPPSVAPLVEPALLERFARTQDPADLRTLAETLGKLGGPAALPALRGIRDADPLLSQIVERAVLRIERSIDRPHATTSLIRVDRELPTCRVVLRCRAGLTAILVEELRARGLVTNSRDLEAREPAATKAGSDLDGRVSFPWSRPISTLFAARTWSSLAFALPVSSTSSSDDDLADVVAAALCDAQTRALFAALAGGEQVRYRLHFADGGHRRATVFRIAAAVKKQAPQLLNDPKASPFSVEIFDRSRGALSIELLPRIDDPRFDYHLHDVPAASHPPIAAALVRLAEAGRDDVVWDPFVGSGTELLEFAKTTQCRRLLGTDLDDEALAVAQKNITAAAITGGNITLTLHKADALTFAPPVRPTRIVTNPPMGRRTRPGQLSTFLTSFVERAAALLPSRGRLIWISPQPRLTTPLANARGLRLLSARPVDLHGFWGSLEVWEKP